MSESNKSIHDLAAQYLDLWQKQMGNQQSNRAMDETLKSSQEFAKQSQDFLQSMNSPEKMQDWMTTWADSWKAQFEDGTNPFEQFSTLFPTAPASGASSSSAAHEPADKQLDELTDRVALLEKRIAELEARLKD